MEKKIIYLVSWAMLSTLIAVVMTVNVVKLLETNEVTVQNEPVSCPTLVEQLSERAYELREEHKDMDLERYRQDAIREINLELQAKIDDSPFISYDDLEEKYGY